MNTITRLCKIKTEMNDKLPKSLEKYKDKLFRVEELPSTFRKTPSYFIKTNSSLESIDKKYIKFIYSDWITYEEMMKDFIKQNNKLPFPVNILLNDNFYIGIIQSVRDKSLDLFPLILMNNEVEFRLPNKGEVQKLDLTSFNKETEPLFRTIDKPFFVNYYKEMLSAILKIKNISYYDLF